MGLFDDLASSSELPGRAPIPPAGRALLDTIAGTESPGYDVLYGGRRFTDYADHPRQAIPIMTGPNAGKVSTAAGRYQFLSGTWDDQAKKLGLTSFAPENQDAAAWNLAQEAYKARTGRDLSADLEAGKGNPNAINSIGRALSGTWTSLPGGIEANRTADTFGDRYARASSGAGASPRPAGLFDDLAPPVSDAQFPAPEGNPLRITVRPKGVQEPTPSRFMDDTSVNVRAAREGTSPPIATAGEAAKKGFFRSATFNWLDELYGLAAAGGASEKELKDPNGDPAAAMGYILKGAYALANGDKDAQNAYRVTTSQQRAEQERMREQQPGASVAGEVGGALTTLPFGGPATRGLTLGGRMVQGARTGAVLGALSGTGEGDGLTERAGNTAVGGILGLATGAATPAAVEGVVQAGRGLGAIAAPVTRAVRGIVNPDAEAGRRVISAMQRDAAAGAGGMTPAEFAAARQAGEPAALIDVGGETTRGLARSAANTSTEARAALNTTINDRYESQSGRMADWFNRTFHYPNAQAQQEAIEQTARQVNTPAYRRAYGDPRAQSLWDEGFEQIAQAPVVQDAIRGASRTGANRAAIDGFTPQRSPFRFDEQSQRMVLADQNVRPNLQFWDHVKRNLDDTISRLQRSGENSAARDAIQLRSALVGHLDDLVPSFQQARAGAAHFFGAENALEAGQNFVRQNFATREVRQQLARMTPTERQLFQDGFVSRFVETLEQAGDRRNILNQIAASPAAREKLQLVMGPQRWTELESRLRVEGIMDLARSAVQGNSTTTRQLVELGLAGGVGGYGQISGDPNAMMNAAITWGALYGHRRIDQRVARRVGEMLASSDPAVLQRGIQLVARNRNLLEALRAFDRSFTRVSSSQAERAMPALQAPASGRAEDNQ